MIPCVCHQLLYMDYTKTPDKELYKYLQNTTRHNDLPKKLPPYHETQLNSDDNGERERERERVELHRSEKHMG